MKRPKLLCSARLDRVPDVVELLRQHTDALFVDDDRQQVMAALGDRDAYWGHMTLKVDAELLDHGPQLRLVATATTGTDHLDKRELAHRGIHWLCTAADTGILETFTATAECAWMLLQACQRRLRTAWRQVEAGDYRTEGPVGRQLFGQTLGVLGVGRLGRMSCGFAPGFGMRVIACDPRPFAIEGVERVDFETLLRTADAITIHIHLTPENRGLFNAATLAKMKRGATLINTSRGDIVDEGALLAALESGQLGAYGADVIHDEWRTDLRQSALIQYALTHDNVVLTPHMGGATDYSIGASRRFMARKLIHWLHTGEELTMPSGVHAIPELPAY